MVRLRMIIRVYVQLREGHRNLIESNWNSVGIQWTTFHGTVMAGASKPFPRLVGRHLVAWWGKKGEYLVVHPSCRGDENQGVNSSTARWYPPKLKVGSWTPLTIDITPIHQPQILDWFAPSLVWFLFQDLFRSWRSSWKTLWPRWPTGQALHHIRCGTAATRGGSTLVNPTTEPGSFGSGDGGGQWLQVRSTRTGFGLPRRLKCQGGTRTFCFFILLDASVPLLTHQASPSIHFSTSHPQKESKR